MAQRIESVDVLRGFTIAAMILVNTPGTWSHVYKPLLHANWNGLTPTDLIFPFFLFIVGISIHFAYKNKIKARSTYKKIAIRSLKLVGLGLFLNIFLPYAPFFKDFETVRIPGVLQRIGVVFFFSAIVYLQCSLRSLIIVSVIILIGYWAFLGFVPFPDGVLPTFDRAPNNWANYVDLVVLKSHMWQPDYDPEGIFSTLPSIVTCISGILIAKYLDTLKHINSMLLIAIGLIALGYIVHLWFPINKALWSSSFVLVTSGIATFFLSLLYFIMDIKQIKFGSIFKYIGMNAITVYFLSSLISKSMYLTKIGEGSNVHNYVYTTFFNYDFLSEKFSSLIYALTVVGFYLLLGYIMYKKKIFIKV